MSSGTTTARSSNNRFPLQQINGKNLNTSSCLQVHHLWHPIPPHLHFSIKTSLDSPSSKLMLHHSPNSMGCNSIQMRFGREIDPEPGRCRRTDGKKWRCSKEAFTDSKYCERQMHRGKNRSRKPVEVNAKSNNNLSTPQTSIPPKTIRISSLTKFPNYPSSMASADSHNLHNVSYIYSQSPSSKNMGFEDPFLMDSASYSHSEKDYRRKKT